MVMLSVTSISILTAQSSTVHRPTLCSSINSSCMLRRIYRPVTQTQAAMPASFLPTLMTGMFRGRASLHGRQFPLSISFLTEKSWNLLRDQRLPQREQGPKMKSKRVRLLRRDREPRDLRTRFIMTLPQPPAKTDHPRTTRYHHRSKG